MIDNNKNNNKKTKINLDVEKNFSELIDKASPKLKNFVPGHKVKASYVGTSGDWVFVDFGGRNEAIIAKEEFIDENGNMTIKTGDVIDAYFLLAKDGEIQLTTKLNGYKISNAILKDANLNQIPVEGYVMSKIKGGYEVMVSSKRAFCPFSHMELGKGTDSSEYLAKRFNFHILEFNEGGRNIILTRKKILKEEKEKVLTSLKEKIKVGEEVEGIVRSIQPFGAFVDLGGVDALIPLSEMSWGRVKDPSKYIKLRQKVTVKVTSVDWDKKRISLSLKQVQKNPWDTITERYAEENWVKGKVVELVDFGVFVELEPGINGLIHISNLNAINHINHPKEVINIGDIVDIRILSIDKNNRRISLSMEPEKIDPFKNDLLIKKGDVLEGSVESVKPYGIFVKLPNGITGLVPSEEIGLVKGDEHEDSLTVGDTIKVTVIHIDKEKKRIKLSRKSVKENENTDSFKEYVEKEKSKNQNNKTLSAFGSLLKEKIEEKMAESISNKNQK